MTTAFPFGRRHDSTMHWRRGALVTGLVFAARCGSPDTVEEIPPPPPDGGAASGDVSTFAIQTLFLGEAPADGGAPSSRAWKAFGYDLDGLITTEASTNVCTLAAAPPSHQLDGENGIDNAWGATLLPIFQAAFDFPKLSADVSDTIDSGSWTLQIQVTGLTSDPHQSALGLGAQVFVSGPSSSPPTFDSSTDWPVLPSSLSDGQSIAGGAKVQFSQVYVTDGTVVAKGASQPIVMPLVLTGRFCPLSCDNEPVIRILLPVRIHDATLTFVYSSNTAARGIIAGVLDTQEVTDTVRHVLVGVSTSFCGSAIDGIAQQLAQAQDILQDGTNAPGVPCNAISIGLGFVAQLVANPTKVGVDPPVPPDPCDAGTD